MIKINVKEVVFDKLLYPRLQAGKNIENNNDVFLRDLVLCRHNRKHTSWKINFNLLSSRQFFSLRQFWT